MTIGPPKGNINPWAAAFTNGLGGLSDMFAKLAMKKISDEDKARQDFERDRTYQLGLQGQLNQEDQFNRTFQQNAANTDWQHQQHLTEYNAGRQDVQDAGTRTNYNMYPTLTDQTAERAGVLGLPVNNPTVGNVQPSGMNLLPGMTQATPGFGLGERGAYTRPDTRQEQYTGTLMGNAKSQEERAAATAEQNAIKFDAEQNALGHMGQLKPGQLPSFSDLAVTGRSLSSFMTPDQARGTNYIKTYVGKDANGNDQFKMVPETNGAIVTGAPDKAPAMTGGQADALAALGSLQVLAKQALDFGNEHKWAGVGYITGPASEMARQIFGTGTPEEGELRKRISQLFGDIAKQRGGSALTPTEIAQLEKYAPTINESGASLQDKLNGMLDYLGVLETEKRKMVQERRPGGSPLAGINFDQLIKDAIGGK